MQLAIRCARDSVPLLRLAILEDLAAHPDSTPGDVRRVESIDLPENSLGPLAFYGRCSTEDMCLGQESGPLSGP